LDWPAGEIQYQNLSVKYSEESPNVLHSINFKVSINEKLAIVGRTSAGKSSLALALLRLIPYSEGTILIDGIDISKMSVYELRSKITIIPQDPVLFSGSLRSNLDPQNKHDDAAIWEALQRVRFFESIQKPGDQANNAELNLDYVIHESGSNISQGQKQLLCLARSLLQNSKIVIFDEATAAVDNNTDIKLQEAIRREFRFCTVICIAHRLRTIIDYDSVLVMDSGSVIERGTPLQLMKHPENGIFRRMCEDSGDYDNLVMLASKKFNGL
jgi:ABC-type multidrug transport system fused ATPase/permease subunit